MESTVLFRKHFGNTAQVNTNHKNMEAFFNELTEVCKKEDELKNLNLPHVINAVCDECDGSGWWKENEIDKVIVCPKCKGKQTDL